MIYAIYKMLHILKSDLVVLIFKLCKCIFPQELTILKIQSKKAALKSDLRRLWDITMKDSGE